MLGTYFRAFFLAKYLVKQGHKVLLVIGSKRAAFKVTRKLVDGVEVFLHPLVDFHANLLVGSLSRISTTFMQALLNCILEITCDFDILHSFDVMWPQNTLPTLISTIKRSLKISEHKVFVDWDDWWGGGGLLTQRGTGIPYYPYQIAPLLEFLEEKVPLCADAVTVTNETLKQHALKSGVKSEDLYMIPNGANIDFIKPFNMHDAREELNLPMEGLIYTHVGSSSLDIEAFNHLILAHKNVVKRCSDALLLLVGKIRKDEINLIKALNVTKNVLWVGPQPDSKYRLYLSASDAFLLPMKDNIFNRARWPLRLGDYLAAGRPIIATDLPEIKKVVSECGLLAKPNDPKDFASKILEIITDQDLREKMAKRARELAERNFSWQILANQLGKIYNQYVSSS